MLKNIEMLKTILSLGVLEFQEELSIFFTFYFKRKNSITHMYSV